MVPFEVNHEEQSGINMMNFVGLCVLVDRYVYSRTDLLSPLVKPGRKPASALSREMKRMNLLHVHRQAVLFHQ